MITKTEYNKLQDEEKKGGNFLVKHNTNKYFFVLNEYKTSKKYGEKNIEIDEEVLRISLARRTWPQRTAPWAAQHVARL